MIHAKKTASVALLALLASPLAAAVEKVAGIDVTVDVTAITNAEAATFWADLEADLENAIAARVTDRLAAEEVKPDENGVIDGTQIKVDIREVELASAFERELNLGDAVLVGQVTIVDTDSSNADGYELQVSLENAQVVVPEGAVLLLSTDTSGAYTRLVEAFADGIVTRLK
ncbi:MAG: LPS assembly lipoprotein LptE [Pseudomonadota bacterium]|uniref:LPS assembly lipoprotein LptE n=1 Tax=Tabrizicola sp. TaxID=2005166 RepID=UPI0025EE3DBB|nr:LPS assembly lipoprotein LptE [Tabrizicola sp.]